MPNRPNRACLVCRSEALPGESYCKEHSTVNPATVSKHQYDKFRYREKHRRLYHSAGWKQLRLFIISRDPVCVECNRAASTVADHIIDHKGDFRLFFDPKNLRGLCRQCHDEKDHGFVKNREPVPEAGTFTVSDLAQILDKDGNALYAVGGEIKNAEPYIVGSRVCDFADRFTSDTLKRIKERFKLGTHARTDDAD